MSTSKFSFITTEVFDVSRVVLYDDGCEIRTTFIAMITVLKPV